MSQKVTGSTTAARNDAVSAVKMSGKSRGAVEHIQAAVNALADAVDDLDERIVSDTRATRGDAAHPQPGLEIIMPGNVSASVAGCYEHAEECARRAKFAATLQLRDEYLTLERGWIQLARNTQACERITVFDQDKKNPE